MHADRREVGYKRVRRLLACAVTALSMALCLVTLGLWTGGHWTTGTREFGRQYGWGVTSSEGVIYGHLIDSAAPRTAADWWVWSFWDRPDEPKFDPFGTESPSTKLLRRAGFTFFSDYMADGRGAVTLRRRAVSCPHAFLAALLSIAPLRAGWRMLRHRQIADDPSHRSCPACGYDLRATPDRCPECGTAVPAAPSA
jgi:hypothetical protein